MEELERLKQDLTLQDAPVAGAPPPVPMSTRPGVEPSPTGMKAKAVYDYEVSWVIEAVADSQAAEDVR